LEPIIIDSSQCRETGTISHKGTYILCHCLISELNRNVNDQGDKQEFLEAAVADQRMVFIGQKYDKDRHLKECNNLRESNTDYIRSYFARNKKQVHDYYWNIRLLGNINPTLHVYPIDQICGPLGAFPDPLLGNNRPQHVYYFLMPTSNWD
jgi:hypothetical protein